MIIKRIEYGTDFIKEFKRLPDQIKQIAVTKEKIFQDNPLHPSLRLHPLKGKLKNLWSISISGGNRIVFERKKNGDIVFISIGTHDIYKYL